MARETVNEETQVNSYGAAFLAVVLALLGLGLVMVFSASFAIAPEGQGFRGDLFFFGRQAIAAALGLVGMALLARIDYHWWRYLSLLVLIAAIALLLAVQHPGLGQIEYGAQRWLKLGPLPEFQPSEVAKLAVVVYFATWLAGKRTEVKHLAYGSIPFVLILTLVIGLIATQPDLGTSLVVLAIAFAIFFAAGANLLHFALGVAGGGVAIVLFIFSSGYRLQRLLTFFDPETDTLGRGWQVLQSQIALGSGGLFGAGLGNSVQKFLYLPGPHTDTIFAILGEELGFLGTAAIVLLFALLAYFGHRVAQEAPDRYGQLLAIGVTTWLTSQAFINVAVVAGLLPFTGVPLPFVSSGGSSLVAALLGTGILLSVARRRPTANGATKVVIHGRVLAERRA